MANNQQITFKDAISNSDYQGVLDVQPEDLKKKLLENSDKLKLIDVREPHEFTGELGHIENASLVPLATIPQAIASFSPDQTIVFICRSGQRSARASAFALESGLSSVYNLNGGMLRWNQLGFAIQK